MGHECLKSSLAFRKPAVAAASRRPARADGPKVKVGLDGPASLGAGRAPWSALGRLGYSNKYRSDAVVFGHGCAVGLCSGTARAVFTLISAIYNFPRVHPATRVQPRASPGRRLLSQLVPVSDRPRSCDRRSRPSRSVGRRAGASRLLSHPYSHRQDVGSRSGARRPLDRA